MRNRLVELIKKAYSHGIKTAFESEENNKSIDELVADHLLAEGVIVPKVKIGDKLYAINASRTRVNEYYVTHLEVYDCGVKIFGRPIYCREEYWLCWSQDLGNVEMCVFLTKVEAEAALERREG